MSGLHFTHTFNPKLEHRVHEWIDTKKLKPLYGIQQHERKGVWAHYVDTDGVPVLHPKRKMVEKLIAGMCAVT